MPTYLKKNSYHSLASVILHTRYRIKLDSMVEDASLYPFVWKKNILEKDCVIQEQMQI